MEERKQSAKYKEMGESIIAENPDFEYIRNSHAKIAWLSSTHQKKAGGKTTFAQCEKVANKNKWSIPYDFTITVFEPNCEGFTLEQIRILLTHELMHVGIDTDELGNEAYYIIKHDLEDFRGIVELYGPDWARKKLPHEIFAEEVEKAKARMSAEEQEEDEDAE